MGNRRDSVHSVESIRASDVRRLLNKLCLSPEQEEAIENLSRSLVEELVRWSDSQDSSSCPGGAKRIGGYRKDIAWLKEDRNMIRETTRKRLDAGDSVSSAEH